MTFFKILVRIKRLNCEITTIYSVHLENFFAVGKVYFQYLSKYVLRTRKCAKDYMYKYFLKTVTWLQYLIFTETIELLYITVLGSTGTWPYN